MNADSLDQLAAVARGTIDGSGRWCLVIHKSGGGAGALAVRPAVPASFTLPFYTATRGHFCFSD